jgi:hypothetical protein
MRGVEHPRVRKARIFFTRRLLAVLASTVVLLSSIAGGHALLAEASWAAVHGAASSSSAPDSIPSHGEAECSFCESGSSAFTATLPCVALGIRVGVERTSSPFRATALPTWQASSGAARAPPFDRLG